VSGLRSAVGQAYPATHDSSDSPTSPARTAGADICAWILGAGPHPHGAARSLGARGEPSAARNRPCPSGPSPCGVERVLTGFGERRPALPATDSSRRGARRRSGTPCWAQEPCAQQRAWRGRCSRGRRQDPAHRVQGCGGRGANVGKGCARYAPVRQRRLRALAHTLRAAASACCLAALGKSAERAPTQHT
jgi:hypothetical protein